MLSAILLQLACSKLNFTLSITISLSGSWNVIILLFVIYCYFIILYCFYLMLCLLLLHSDGNGQILFSIYKKWKSRGFRKQGHSWVYDINYILGWLAIGKWARIAIPVYQYSPAFVLQWGQMWRIVNSIIPQDSSVYDSVRLLKSDV